MPAARSAALWAGAEECSAKTSLPTCQRCPHDACEPAPCVLRAAGAVCDRAGAYQAVHVGAELDCLGEAFLVAALAALLAAQRTLLRLLHRRQRWRARGAGGRRVRRSRAGREAGRDAGHRRGNPAARRVARVGRLARAGQMALADVDLRRLINARAARPGSPCRAEPLPRDISAAAEAVGVPQY